MDNVEELLWLDKLEGITDLIEFLEEENKNGN